MKNRYIPFGYQMQNGDSVINTEQAATVQHIFYAYTEGQSFKEIAEYLTTSGTAYHFSDNNWNKNIVARILANEIYCGAKGYPAIISKEVYSQAASIRSNKTVTYSAVLKPFRSDMQCACCGERLYWRPRTQQWTCRQCGMWSKPMQPENMAQQIVDRLYQMIQDCKKKKIDLILTKSISRFARNTLDSIQYVRMLKAIGIAVIFEKENINTSTMNSEMILTVLSAFAQAESESISQNVARGKRMGFRQGKFPFPYGQILGYRKGLDGKPEVIPEEAEVIRMIFNSYLQGASLLTIKKKLEAGGVLTARGNKKWSSESVQRILQNEKYCGDVLLQKTFIEDVLTGVSKKNTGQLPQYYIENNHEGIVTKQMFREVQAEIARRNSKSAANQRKRHQGRYNSKYALSERLVCGDCGSPYKRVTWNIHGRKQIVWRCVNRLEYGTKFCSHSPSIPEEELHQAILKAVQNLAANFTDEVAAQLDGILRQMKAGENLKAQLQKQLEKAQQEFDRLLEMSLELDESTPFLDDKLRKLSGKIKILKANIAESTDGKGEDEEATKQLTAQDLLIKEYDDILTARIIEKVIVHSRQEIEIYFIGGYTQKIDLI